MPKVYFFLVILLQYPSYLYAQTPVVKILSKNSTALQKFKPVVNYEEHFSLVKNELNKIQEAKPQNLSLELSFKNTPIQLQLEKANITTKSFSALQVNEKGEKVPMAVPEFLCYRGKINGQINTMASLCFFNNQVVGILSDGEGNINLGPAAGGDDYIMFRDQDFNQPVPFNCGTPEGKEPEHHPHFENENVPQNTVFNTAGQKSIEIYLECDHQFYLNRGRDAEGVIKYVLNLFNNVSTIYANEQLDVRISQILVWATPNPEAKLDTIHHILDSFSVRMLNTNYSGNYAHLLSGKNLNGGIAWLSDNCNSKFSRAGVSTIYSVDQDLPLYSTSVYVLAHELGHNFGSNHTHWCGWEGGPIDGCAPTYHERFKEGNCANGPLPAKGNGTIMSYCHLLSAVGVSLSKGFGKLPGDAIRKYINNGPCFSKCNIAADLKVVNATCFRKNGQITVEASSDTIPLTYTWNTGATGNVLSKVPPGTYYVTINDASGCQILKLAKVENNPDTIHVSLSPNGDTSICKGSSITFTASGEEDFTYAWYKNGKKIVGAGSNIYTSFIEGTYSVVASAGNCKDSQAVVVRTPFETMQAGYTFSGSSTICAGGLIGLQAFASEGFSYQWYRNNLKINGATQRSFSVTESGDYHIEIASPFGCKSSSSATTFTVVDFPKKASLTTNEPRAYCLGQKIQTTLTAPSGSGYEYEWYHNDKQIEKSATNNLQVSNPGDYFVIISNGNCRSAASDPIKIVVNPPPQFTISPADTLIQKFDTVVLRADAGLSYNWQSLPHFIKSNQNSATFRPLATTRYQIIGINNNGCSDSVNATVRVEGCGNITNIQATDITNIAATIKWDNPEDVTADSIYYRKKSDAAYLPIWVAGNQLQLSGLQPESEYEFFIKPLCNATNAYSPTPLQSFATKRTIIDNPIVIPPVIITELSIKLFPNPTLNNNPNLELSLPQPATADLKLYNTAGKKVWQQAGKVQYPVGKTIIEIKTRHLASGVYLLHVRINDTTTKVIKLLVNN